MAIFLFLESATAGLTAGSTAIIGIFNFWRKKSAAAAVADRYRLDTSDAPKKKSGGGAGSMITFLVAMAALIVSGILTFVMYQHWEFLKGA